VVWTTTLIKKFKRDDNAISRAVDLWFDSTIGGYITEFAIDIVELYSQAEGISLRDLEGSFYTF
jgi:hypothetical protein